MTCGLCNSKCVKTFLRNVACLYSLAQKLHTYFVEAQVLFNKQHISCVIFEWE